MDAIATSNKATSLASRCLSYSHGTADIPLLPYTIGQMLNRTAEKYADNEMYVFYSDEERFTFGEFRNQTHLFAAGLLNLGLQKGDRVAVWGNAHKEYLLTYHACAQIGLIFVRLIVPVVTELNGQLLKKLGCKALVITRSPLNGYTEVCKVVTELPRSEPGKLTSSSLPDLKIVIAADESFSNSKGVLTIEGVLRLGGSSAEARDRITSLAWEINSEDDFTVFFTSGSTGSPKAVVHCQQALLNSVRMGTPYRKGTSFVADWIPKVALLITPAGAGHEYGVLNPVITGNTTVFACPMFQPDAFLKAVHQERCNESLCLIQHIYDLVNHPDVDLYDMSCMKAVMTGGSIIPDKLMKAAKEKLAKHVILAYGATECCVVFHQSQVDHPDKLATAAVYPDPHIEVKIVDSQGQTVFTNTVGEIQMRGYSVFKFYWGDEEATQQCKTKHGWYKTGDLGIMDDDGFFRILGRQKEVIHKAGNTFFPKQLENVLEHHDSVSKALVFGVPDERLLEEVCACVKLKSPASVDADTLRSFCKGKAGVKLSSNVPRNAFIVSLPPRIVSNYEAPTSDHDTLRKITQLNADSFTQLHQSRTVHDLLVPRNIFIVSELPTTPTGKFHRKKLREWAIAQLTETM